MMIDGEVQRDVKRKRDEKRCGREIQRDAD